ncbi:MAG TPA: tRNA wybutosine-synthesizing 3 family protein, partial [Candidatus Nanoarchaeia archaeon]|nr:tRNA wybutosine-synthesizing 3 family protein [Candidatus Nanoarchaeia archaeon]
MPFDSFLRRKTSVLSKIDKSFIGKWDEKIIPLCNKINSSPNYYTTSSCAGRIVLMISQNKKSHNLFLKISHELISFNWLKNNLNKIKNKFVKFKCEPPILHVVCRNLESASLLLEKAKISGMKHSGIHCLGRNIILEIHGDDRLEFPIFSKNKILVDDDFLKLAAKESNEKLKKSWKMIENL